jgi:hypothetical protein
MENNIPLELAGGFNSGKSIRILTIQESLRTNDLVNQDFSITNHPKVRA